MDEKLKNELIHSLSQNYGYEKAMEIIDATEYVNYLNDEKVNTLIEMYYTFNNKLIKDNVELMKTIEDLKKILEKKDKKNNQIIFYSILILIFSLLLLFYKI